MNSKTGATTKRQLPGIMRRAVTPCLILLAVGTCMATSIQAHQDVQALPLLRATRKPAPAFNLVSQDGKTIRPSDYRGKVLLLNFWATSCGGCVLEIPSFIELQKVYHDKGFTAVGVSMDVSYEDLKDADEAWARVRPFVAKNGVNYPIAMGDAAVAKAYDLNSFPATYLIDKQGKIAVSYVGVVVKKDNVEANIRTLLSEH